MRIRSTDILFGLPALELRRLLQRVDAWDSFDVETLHDLEKDGVFELDALELRVVYRDGHRV